MSDEEQEREIAIIYEPEWVGQVDVSSDVLMIGDFELRGVGGGYPIANIFVQRMGASHHPHFPIAKIHIEIMGDYWSQRELDAQNEEAANYPLGPREYWRAKGLWDEDDNEDYEAWLEEQEEDEKG